MNRFRFFLVWALCLLPTVLFAQETVATAPWFIRQVGVGVVWKQYHFDNLYGLRQTVSVLEADLTNPGVQVTMPYLAASRGKTSVFTPQQFPGAAGAVNGTFFKLSPEPGGCDTYLKINGSVVTPEQRGGWGIEGAICRSATNGISVRRRPGTGWGSLTTQQDIMANGPVILFDSAVPDLAPTGVHCSARHPRSAYGVTTTNKLLLVTVDGRTDGASGMTCDELGQLMRDLGCDDAVSMDGGGSTTMWVRGEENGGVVNYPSDNGAFDHLGERACSNAVAIVSPPAPPAAWDARLVATSYSAVMEGGTSQTVTLTYRNIGTQTWTAGSTRLKLTRPRTRTSPFAAGSGWSASDTAANLSVSSVAPNELTTFSFVLTAPQVTTNTIYYEHFGLDQAGVGPFGPADHEARFKLIVQAATGPDNGVIIVESRAGGRNFQWYSETGGWADVAVDCTASGLTPNIGMRYGSTYRSVAGAKAATYRPDFAASTVCDVFVAWGAAGLRRSPVTYEVVHAGGTTTYQIDQTSTANQWVLLGRHTFNAGTGGYVRMSNSNIDVSGNMYSAAVRFDPTTVPVRLSEWGAE